MRGLALALLLTAPLGAQHVISAMAGYIHHIEGEAYLQDRPVESKPAELNHVIAGQTLRTGDGYAEILLTPRSFLRLAHDSAIDMIDGGLTAARFKLTRGSAVVDLPVLFDPDSIVVILGETEVSLNKTGRYALTADPPEVIVLSGRADVRTDATASDVVIPVKNKRHWTPGTEPAKLDQEPSSELLAWSEGRRKKLDDVLAAARKSGDIDGMDPVYRQWLEMAMRRPSPQVRQPQTPQPRTPSGPRTR